MRQSNAVRPTSVARSRLIGCSERYLTYSASALLEATKWPLPVTQLEEAGVFRLAQMARRLKDRHNNRLNIGG